MSSEVVASATVEQFINLASLDSVLTTSGVRPSKTLRWLSAMGHGAETLFHAETRSIFTSSTRLGLGVSLGVSMYDVQRILGFPPPPFTSSKLITFVRKFGAFFDTPLPSVRTSYMEAPLTNHFHPYPRRLQGSLGCRFPPDPQFVRPLPLRRLRNPRHRPFCSWARRRRGRSGW